ncbi:MAG: SpoIIE family protein phosphatase [Spirochaetaceae bacterium]|nr:SpoIIE family protein phosphatase [Spirochaetaceae bacterium]
MQADTGQTEENYRLLAENSSDLIVRLSIEGICEYVSPACETLLGYSPKELHGRQAFDFIHPMDKRTIAAAIEPEILFQSHKSVLCRLRRKNGFYGWFEATFRFFSNVETKELQAVVVVRDVGTRIRAERFETVRHAIMEIRASDNSLEAELPQLLNVICSTLQWEIGQIWLVDEGAMVLRQTSSWYLKSASLARIADASAKMALAPGVGLPGTIWSKGEVYLIDDIASIQSLVLRQYYRDARIKSAIGSPLVDGPRVYGVILFMSRRQIQHNTGLLDMIAGAGYELGEFITKQRARAEYRAEYEKRGVQVLEKTDRVRILQDEVSRRQRLEQDLILAAEVQRSLLPVTSPSLTSFELASAAFPARYISGDFYDFFSPEHSVLDIIIADVSGKGIAAALMTSASRALFRSGIDADKNPAEKLKKMNFALYPDCDRTEMFLTAQIVRLDLERGTAIFSSAGHTEALCYRHLEKKCICLASTAIPLGIIGDIDVGELNLDFLPGDFLILYSDGVTEAMNCSGELFGIARLIDIVQHMADASASELVSMVLSGVREFSGSEPLADDLTLIALKATPRTFSMETKACLEYLDSTMAFVRESVLPCGAGIADDIELVASELFTNAAIHGRGDNKQDGSASPGDRAVITPEDEGLRLDICIRIESSKILIDLFYFGEFFDPRLWRGALPEPEEEGGRGIHIIRALADGLSYAHGKEALPARRTCGIEDGAIDPTLLNHLHVEKSMTKGNCSEKIETP